MTSMSMKHDPHLSRALADSLLEVVQACHNKKRLNNIDTMKKSEIKIWFENVLNSEMLSNLLISHEQEWLTVICEMVTESKRTLKGDENLYALDEEFPNQHEMGKKKVMSYHRRYRYTILSLCYFF